VSTTQLSVGLAGTGYMATKHSEVLSRHQETALTRICSTERSAGVAHELAERYGYADVTSDFEALLADDVALVYVCSPDGTHAEYTSKALRAGKHVFCEKPLGRTADELASVRIALEESGTTLQVGMNCRYRARYRALKDAAGGLGELRYLRGIYLQNVVDTVRSNEKPWWVTDSAGPLTFLHGGGLHALDLMRWIGGDVASVLARAAALELEDEWGLDTFSVSLGFQSEAVGELLVSAAAPRPNDFRLEAWLTEGSVLDTTVHRDGGDGEPLPAEQGRPDLELQLEDLVEAIRGGSEPSSSYAHADANFRVIDAIGRSIETGEAAQVMSNPVESNL
jgi:predicted dehydrogenase